MKEKTFLENIDKKMRQYIFFLVIYSLLLYLNQSIAIVGHIPIKTVLTEVRKYNPGFFTTVTHNSLCLNLGNLLTNYWKQKNE